MKKHYITMIAAALAVGAQAQSISPGGIYAAANVNTTPNSSLEWVLGNINAFTTLSVLPVKLIRFEGKVTADGAARLEWETAEEYNNAGFEIQRSPNASSFEKIGFVDGGGTTHTNKVYSYLDPGLQTTMYYRLAQIDADGKTTLSQIVSVVPDHEKLDRFKAYPNPSRDGKITVTVPERTFTLSLWDVYGRRQQEITRPGVTENLELPSSGTYILHIESIAGQKTLPVIRE